MDSSHIKRKYQNGFLYYAKYKESGKAKFLLASKRLIQKSLNLDNSYVKLRAATFFFTHLDYSQSNEICDKFLTFPPRRTSNCQFIHPDSLYFA
jgi:hypothetical protein